MGPVGGEKHHPKVHEAPGDNLVLGAVGLCLSKISNGEGGYHVETWGGGQWTSVAWFSTKAGAEIEAKYRGLRSGMVRVMRGRRLERWKGLGH